MNKILVVIGGGSGLGFSCANEIGQEGYLVIISGTNENKLLLAKEKLEKNGIKCFFRICDVSNKKSVLELLNYAKSLGEIWAVINAAGIAPPKTQSHKAIIDVNALGIFYISEIFYKEMINGGCIINIASICAYEIPRILRPKHIYKLIESNPNKCKNKMIRLSKLFGKKNAANLAYAISKCFVVYYSKKVSRRFYKDNEIRILSISPSNFLTDMGKADLNERPNSVAKYFNKQAINKSGNPEDFGFLVKCLIDARMKLLTASDIHIDGGVAWI